MPCTFVVNPPGKLKAYCHRCADGTVVKGDFRSLFTLVRQKYYEDGKSIVPRERPLAVQSLDFNSSDTVDYSAFDTYGRTPRICTSEESK